MGRVSPDAAPLVANAESFRLHAPLYTRRPAKTVKGTWLYRLPLSALKRLVAHIKLRRDPRFRVCQ